MKEKNFYNINSKVPSYYKSFSKSEIPKVQTNKINEHNLYVYINSYKNNKVKVYRPHSLISVSISFICVLSLMMALLRITIVCVASL